MNARFYRLIYNRTRALLMAVAEISRSYSGAGAASTVKAASLVNKSFDGRLKAVTLKPLTFRTYLALGLATISLPSLLFTPSAFASTIIADSSHKEQPMVINSANGTTQVNIVTPNKHGLSHNRYSQFDVSGQGVILNNSGKNSKTQLAGYIEGNQALMQSGGAKIILNEVNSSRPSELNGYIEVAGQKAQVIIANSAGITCSGCGFINAGRSTLTTGKPVINEGQLTGYQVTNGTINVEGKGFDASRSDYTDLIARAVQINSAIWANEANVITGQNEVSLDTKTVTPLDISSTNQTDNSNNNSNITDRPEFAIDVAALGGMYAGKIRMIGTEKGVGVRSAGELGASAGSITLSADGKIINLGAMQANTAINLNSRGDIQNEKQLYSHGDIALSSQKDIKNSGSVVAGQNITLISGDAGNGNSNGNSDGANSYGTITSSKGSTLAAGVDDKGRLTKAGSISAHADNITLHGSNLATKSIDLKSQNALDLQGSEVQTGSLTANASKMALQNASINAKEDINLTADTINHKAATLLGSNLHITADSLSGDGKLLAGQNITLNLKEAFTNQSDIIANGNINVNHESSLTNAGRLLAGESLTLKALASSKRTLATITNKGEMESENITVLGNTLTNYGVINGGAVKLTLTGDFLNLGAARFYGDDILINAVNVKNHGDSLDTKEAPTVAARQKMVINSQTVDNDNHALLLSLGDISIVADTVNNHSATIESQGDMVIIADTINNINDRFITEIAEIDKVDEIKEYSPFGSADRYRPDEVKIEVSKKKNHREWIMTTSDGRYSGYKFYEYNYDKTTYQTLIKETNPANIMAGGNLTIKAKTVNNENSKILAGQNLLLTVTDLNNYSTAGINRVEDIGTVTYHYRKKEKKHGMGTKPDTYHHKTSTSAYQNITETTIDVGNGEIKEHAITPSSSLNDKARDKVNIINNVATIESDIKLPNSAIYSVNKDVDKNYLIESDPKFTNHHKWLSSDYMFDRMRLDPNNIQKRLGDGYYEQQLIKEQVVTLTGQRYLGGYQSDMEQYQALMNAGATFADMYNLTVGVALTKEQMESLTTDIVWFVSKTVEVDGQMEEVLVPQLYIVNRPKVSATGALIAGSNVVIQSDSDINGNGNINSTGAINSKKQLVITSDNITNSGIISGGRLQMASQGSIINHGTILGSDGVNLSAKNDIILESKTKTTTTNYGQNSSSNTAIDRPSQVITTNGDITITAGHDINLAAGQVINQSDKNSSGKITLTAGNDIKLDSVEVSSKQEIHTSKNNYRKSDIKEQVGSTIQGNGNIAINAANDIKVTGSDISSEQNLNLTAGNNIDINSSKEETHLTDHSKVTSSGFLSSETSISHIEVDNETQKGSYLTGENVTLNAGNSMSVIGSDIIADSALNLTAGGDINIDAAKEIYHHYEQNITKKSGLMSSGGLGVTYGSESSDLKQTDNEEAYRGSTVGSLTGSVNISSGKNLTINGSDVIAKEDIKLQGENVAITAQDAKTTYDENYTYKKSGLTVALTGTASDLYEAGKAVKESKKGAMIS
ncbi:filamentous hemagglutinin N-terminal domain-containing protein [Orbaceae bacterium ESL0721]|nr:filamentous hemagglutinin N-terminal domain-containing protein [Orbaceae bacterium ESL0721]